VRTGGAHHADTSTEADRARAAWRHWVMKAAPAVAEALGADQRAVQRALEAEAARFARIASLIAAGPRGEPTPRNQES
jgi:hypothetical protein